MVYFLIALSFKVVHLVTETHKWALTELGSTSDKLQHAQRTYSSVTHHSAWLALLTRLQSLCPPS